MRRCTKIPTTPAPKHRACQMDDLRGVPGSHIECSPGEMMGTQDPTIVCNCLCTFEESTIRGFTSCAFGAAGQVNGYEQWQVCKKMDHSCGEGGVVVVHGRHLRGE